MRLYEGWEEMIRDWLEPSVERHQVEIRKAVDEVGVRKAGSAVIHLRFAAAHEGILYADPTYHPLPSSFYADSLRAIEEAAGEALQKVVVVHGPNCDTQVAEVIDQLQNQFPNAQFVRQSAGRCEDFLVMYCASHLVLSVSTFAWWAGFLGRGPFSKRVFYPYHQKVAPLSMAQLRRWYNRLLPEQDEGRFQKVTYTSVSLDQSGSCMRRSVSGLDIKVV